MNRSLVIFAVAFLSIEISFAESLVSKDEVVGVWMVDPSTFRVRELTAPSPFPGPQLPTNLLAAKLWLKKDGSFVASNIPTGFFFDESSPFTNECLGTWRVETNYPPLQTAHRNDDGTTNWPVVKDFTNSFSEVSLFFSSRASMQGSWARHVRRFARYRFGQEIQSLYIELAAEKDKTGTHEWSVAMRKQDIDDDK